MNIAYNLERINIQNLFFMDSKKNIVMDGKFTKIIYSDDLISTNGISIIIPFHNIVNDKTSNRNILKFQTNDAVNIQIINKLVKIEQDIIEYYKLFSQSNKTPILILRDHIKNGIMKIYKDSSSENNTNVKYMIKISGMWEDQYRIGLTYKFIETCLIR